MKIYWYNEKKNIVGKNVKAARKAANPKLTQEALAEKLQLMGYEIDRITIVRIEKGDRFVPDYEVKALSEALNVTYEQLIDG